MAVKLDELYTGLHPKYGVRLRTKSFFGKTISWIHILEEIEFVSVLRGNELILNSGYVSDEWLKKYIYLLNKANAGGLIIALRNGQDFSQEILDYCNSIEFPLFSSDWKTPFMDIMHSFSSILLEAEQKESSRITALKNAIHNPENPELYQAYFEESESLKNTNYAIVVMGCHPYDSKSNNAPAVASARSLRHLISSSAVYEENRLLVILSTGYQKDEMLAQFKKICKKNSNVSAGIGLIVTDIRDLHRSYETANIAYHLTKTDIRERFLVYDELGIYKLLSDMNNALLYPAFVEETLGPLLKYDTENQTDYLQILKVYFENECSSINTAKSLFFHKNTMTVKLNKIKEILGYDILENDNRTRIVLSFYIMRMGKEYFFNKSF